MLQARTSTYKYTALRGRRSLANTLSLSLQGLVNAEYKAFVTPEGVEGTDMIMPSEQEQQEALAEADARVAFIYSIRSVTGFYLDLATGEYVVDFV